MRFDSLWSRIEAAFLTWRDAKLFFERSVTVSAEFIHAVVGIFILLLAAALLRKPVSSWTPWLIIFAVACFNEVVDLWLEHWPQASIQFGESVNDVLVTMLLPTVLLVTARKAPWLFTGERRSPADSSSGTDAAGPT